MTENEDLVLKEDSMPQEKSKDKKEKKNESTSALRDFVEIVDAIIIAIVSAVLVLSLVFRTGYVDGPSMNSTMSDGDRYIVSGLFYTPKAGDIVVFQPEMSAEDYSLWVKRIIATEGQTVDINGDGAVYVDGVRITEPYLDSYQKTLPKSYSNIEFPLTVPEGTVFVLGDNRLDSTDSRNIGYIDTRKILGKVLFRFAPLDSFGIVN